MQIDLDFWLNVITKNKEVAAPLIGFAGIVLTLLVNGFLARRLEYTKYRREIKVVKYALKAELLQYQKHLLFFMMIIRNTTELDALNEAFSSIPSIEESGIFKSLIPKIGFLGNDAFAIFNTFNLMKALKLRRIYEKEEKTIEASFEKLKSETLETLATACFDITFNIWRLEHSKWKMVFFGMVGLSHPLRLLDRRERQILAASSPSLAELIRSYSWPFRRSNQV
jgi:hypothetical protein